MPKAVKQHNSDSQKVDQQVLQLPFQSVISYQRKETMLKIKIKKLSEGHAIHPIQITYGSSC